MLEQITFIPPQGFSLCSQLIQHGKQPFTGFRDFCHPSLRPIRCESRAWQLPVLQEKPDRDPMELAESENHRSWAERSAVRVRPADVSFRSFGLVSMTALAIAICYADRANIADAIIPMTKEMGWSKSEEGAILSTFFLGYATTQVAGGLLADRWGGKRVLAGAVFLWSASTLLTPTAAKLGFQPLILMRFLMGVGEGPGFPAVHSMIARQVRFEQQSTAVAVVTAASYFGTLAAFFVCPYVIEHSSWPDVFYLFGSAGLVWIPFWLLGGWGSGGATDSAKQNQFQMVETQPSAVISSVVPSAEDDAQDADVTDLDESSPLKSSREEGWGETAHVMRDLLRYKSVWAILAAQYTQSWGLYGMLNWLPTLLSERYGVQLQDSATVTALPYLLQGVIGPVAGVTADSLIRNGMRVKRCRQLMQGGGMLLPAGLLALSASTSSSAEHAAALLTVGLASSALSLAGVSVSHLDIAPTRAGLVFGMGNFAATLGGFVSVWATGQVAEATGSWGAVLALISAHYVVGAALWLAWVDDQEITVQARDG